MTLLLLLLAAGLGAAAAAWGLGRGGLPARAGAVLGALALLAVLGLALVMPAVPVPTDGAGGPAGVPGLPETASTVDGAALDGRLVPTAYLRLVVALWALTGLLLLPAAWLLGGLAGLRGLLPALLATIAGGAVTLAAADPVLGAVSAAATGLACVVVLLAVPGPAAVAVAARELRLVLGSGIVVVGAALATPVVARLALAGGGGRGAIPGGDPAQEAAAAVGLLAVATVLALAMRWGAIPFHRRVPRLVDVAPPSSLPVLLAWTPLPVAVAVMVVLDAWITPLALPLEGERWLLVGLAVLTLVGASLAALLQDDLRHLAGYLVIADAGVVLLAAAAVDPAAWGAVRAWLVVLVASKTALGAWVAVTEDRFATRSVPDLRGWLRRAPTLAAALVLVVLATVGWPGWVAFEARATLASLAAPGGPGQALLLAALLPVPAYLRLLAIGLGPATSRVEGAPPERFLGDGRRVAGLGRPGGASLRRGAAGLRRVTGWGRAGWQRAAARVPWQPRPERLDVELEGAGGEGAGGPGAQPASPARVTGGGAAAEVGEAAMTPGRDRWNGARQVADGARGVAGQARLAASRAGRAGARGGRAAGRLARRTGAGTGELLPAMRRHRVELLSSVVLALAMLAAATSWGAFELREAAAEPAPVVDARRG